MDNACCLLYGNDFYLIDHIAPYASLNQLPLIVSSKEIGEIASTFYPGCKTVVLSPEKLPFYILENFSSVISCHWTLDLKKIFFLAELSLNKEINTIWLPHGQSDKGYASYLKKLTQFESHALVYGKIMASSLFDPSKQSISFVGNYRYEYFLRHQSFYHMHLSKHAIYPNNEKYNVFIAPTWFTEKNAKSFFAQISYTVQSLKNSFNLCMKFHPKTIEQFYFEVKFFKEQFGDISFIDDLPFIYPILESSHCYIGDYSSIGYDFLTFQRPMFFLDYLSHSLPDKERFLTTLGIKIAPSDFLSETIENAIKNPEQSSKEKFKTLYQQIFFS